MFYGTMVARSNHCSSPLGRHNARPAILLRKNRGKLIGCFMVQWLPKATIVVPTLPPKAGRQFAGRRTPVETHQMFYGTMVVENNHCSSPLGRPMSGWPFCFAKTEGNSSDVLWYNGCQRQPLWFPPCRQKQGGSSPGGEHRWKPIRCFMVQWLLKTTIVVPLLAGTMSGRPFCFAKTEGNYRISYSITIAESTAFVSSKCCELWFPPCRQKQGGSWSDGEHRWKPFHIHSTILFREEM